MFRLESIVFALLPAIFVTSAALSQDQSATQLAAFQYWGAWTTNRGLCFAGSYADFNSVEPKPFITISSRPSQNTTDEFSIALNFYPDTSAPVYVQVDQGNIFDLITQLRRGWLRDSASQADLISAMRNGNRISVHAVAQGIGPETAFWYLAGLSDAINRAREACGLPLLQEIAHPITTNAPFGLGNGAASLPGNDAPTWWYLIAGPLSVAAILALFAIFKTGDPLQMATSSSLASANNATASPSPEPPPPQSNAQIPQSAPPPPAAPTQRANLSVVTPPPPPMPELPPQAFSDSGPVKGLALRLKRSQRTNALSKILFVLDARMDVSAENRALIQKYGLGNRVVYDSANREAYAAAAKTRLENSGNHPGFFDSTGRQFLGVGKSFLNLGMAAVHATVAVLSLRITIDSLMKGVHVECKDMDELLEAEGAIMQAAQNLKGHLDTVTTFDGREETFEL